jgi:hypothetical protein
MQSEETAVTDTITMLENRVLVAICNGHAQAEKAITELQRLGFDMKQVSVVSKAYVSDEEIVGCYVAGGRLRVRGGSAAFWERLWDLLGEGGLFVIPGIGPVVIAGSLVNTLAAPAKDAAEAWGRFNPLAVASHSLGIPKNSAYGYECEIRMNKCVLIAFGTQQAQAEAKTAIEKAHAAESVIGHERQN